MNSEIAVRMDVEEIDRVGFFPIADCATLLPAHSAGQAAAAMAARSPSRTAYLPAA